MFSHINEIGKILKKKISSLHFDSSYLNELELQYWAQEGAKRPKKQSLKGCLSTRIEETHDH